MKSEVKKPKRKNAVPVWKITVIVIVSWAASLALGVYLYNNINFLLQNIIPDLKEQYVDIFRNITIVILFFGLSIVIAIPIAISYTNSISRTLDKFNDSLANVAKGDYGAKVVLKTKNRYFRELADNYNKTIESMNSTAILRNDFISSFSHEFKTPIASIKGYTELIRDSGELSKKNLEYANILISECNRLINLAEKTMLISKINSQSSIEDPKIFSLNGQIEDTILLYDGKMREKGIEVECNLSRVKIKSDRNLIKQIWINLIGNAIKYTDNGGKIIIDCYKTDTDCVVTIEDNGIGMDQFTQDRVFDRFYQADASHSEGGLGIGLALCKRIVDLAGGEITFESEKNMGTKFIVTLPIGIEEEKNEK